MTSYFVSACWIERGISVDVLRSASDTKIARCRVVFVSAPDRSEKKTHTIFGIGAEPHFCPKNLTFAQKKGQKWAKMRFVTNWRAIHGSNAEFPSTLRDVDFCWNPRRTLK